MIQKKISIRQRILLSGGISSLVSLIWRARNLAYLIIRVRPPVVHLGPCLGIELCVWGNFPVSSQTLDGGGNCRDPSSPVVILRLLVVGGPCFSVQLPRMLPLLRAGGTGGAGARDTLDHDPHGLTDHCGGLMLTVHVHDSWAPGWKSPV